MAAIYSDAIFWIEIDKIHPNPYQPRRDFDELALKSLADSIRQYGVLQALVVTRKEVEKPDGGLATEYELIAGERRLRAAKLAGLTQVPAQVRSGEDTDLMKLELAIIENIQREDLNPVDRARAFEKLAKEFGFKHGEIGKKVGKSREYVSNTLRILMLPDEMLNALSEGKITEGHTRPLMMLVDRPEEQMTLFKEILFKKINVRDAEGIARRIAFEKVRKLMDPDLVDLEEKFKDTLGTRVRIEKKPARPGEPGGDEGGKITIDFFSKDDLIVLLDRLSKEMPIPEAVKPEEAQPPTEEEKVQMSEGSVEAMEAPPYDAKAMKGEEEDLYSVKNFSI
ncbi:MAG: ParB/RepB/Spo0J family partition protein [Patescibacteria group bacterium]